MAASVANGAVRFTVTDTGKGISKEYQERIFEKFFQVPKAGRREPAWACTSPGRSYAGTVATLAWKANRAKGALSGLLCQEKQRVHRKERPSWRYQWPAFSLPTTSATSAKIGMVLEGAGHAVDEAKDGDEALDLWKQNHPDIAFVDLHMPKMEGLKVLEHIRPSAPKPRW